MSVKAQIVYQSLTVQNLQYPNEKQVLSPSRPLLLIIANNLQPRSNLISIQLSGGNFFSYKLQLQAT